MLSPLNRRICFCSLLRMLMTNKCWIAWSSVKRSYQSLAPVTSASGFCIHPTQWVSFGGGGLSCDISFLMNLGKVTDFLLVQGFFFFFFSCGANGNNSFQALVFQRRNWQSCLHFWKIISLGIKFYFDLSCQQFKMWLHSSIVCIISKVCCHPYLCSPVCDVSFFSDYF